MTLRRTYLLATACTSLALGGWLSAAAAPLAVGSGNEAVIEPAVAHPDETPCTVPLVSKATFGAQTVSYSFAPPAACPGPWAKVVLQMNIALNEGRQFDRSGLLTLAGVPLWFGTTAEPRATLAPAWSFQKDVTNETALFETAQTGTLLIANYQSSVYTSTITASATLLFYPATAAAPAPLTADVVLPVPASGGTVALNAATDQLTTTASLPTNILHATLDLYLQGQSNDEFWYFCVPSALSAQLESCGNTAFREGEITVDGTPAGVAPIFPWIFTGGIDPYLWQPIPGVQTFDFTEFHADLSPFAGVLSDGKPHTIATSVYNADGYFSATGTLRLFLDHASTSVSGGIIRNTLRPAAPVVTPNITTTNGVSSGTVRVSSAHDFIISGTVTGSAGTTTNTVSQTSDFHSNQTFTVSAIKDRQTAQQITTTTTTVSSRGPTGDVSKTTTLRYPLNIVYDFTTQPSGNSVQYTSVNQQDIDGVLTSAAGVPVGQDNLTDSILTGDTLFFDRNFNVTGHKSQSETATYTRTGTADGCSKRLLVATFNVLTTVQTGC